LSGLILIVVMHVFGLSPEAQKDKARAAEMASFAASHGFHFAARPEYTESLNIVAELNAFPLFQSRRKTVNMGGELTAKQKAQLTRTMSFLRAHPMTNVVSGKIDGKTFLLFDYRSTRTGTEHRTKYTRCTPIVMEVPGANLPRFALGPEENAIVSRLKALVGDPDVNLPDFPRFSSAYHLSGNDAQALMALFEAGPAEFFETHGNTFGDCFVQGAGSKLLVCRGSERLPVADMGALLDDTARAAGMLAAVR
jgi:hypothetical protein